MHQLEELAEEYAQLKSEGSSPKVAEAAVKIIDHISNHGLSIPIRHDTMSVGVSSTVLYRDGASYPALFTFLAEVLHTSVPIVVGSCKFGPGEVIVTTGTNNQTRAGDEIAKSLDELRKQITGKRSEILAKYATD